MTVTESPLISNTNARFVSQHSLRSSRFGILLALLACWGCGNVPSPESETSPPRVFLDQKSKEYYVGAGRGSAIPVNPKTGKPTLAETLYCSKCQQWHAVPPLEVLLRTPAARLCTKTKTPLSQDGPLPPKAKQLSEDSALHTEP